MSGSSRRAGGLFGRLRDIRRRLSLSSSPESVHARRLTLGLLALLTAVVAFVTTAVGVAFAPSLALALPVVLGGLLLDLRRVWMLLGLVVVAMLGELAALGVTKVRPGSIVVLLLIGAVAVELARDRARLGLSAGRGESMLVELRGQLQRQGEVPPLPAGWHVDVAQRWAGAGAFGGDFLVSSVTGNGASLELALVDVSGKGLDAAARALLLSGALGGLLGAVPPEQFVAAANAYLLRQEWDEGFATAIHVAIDLRTGRYRATSAGHPPAAHYAGGSGRWSLVDAEGMVLGLADGGAWRQAEGSMARFDALLLYTDGLVEVPGRDLAVGIDRLLGAAEGMLTRGFDGGAQRLIDTVAPAGNDDRAVVLVWRD